MSTAEIKYNLHQLIDGMNDSDTLKAFYAVLLNRKDENKTRLSKEEKKAVIAAREQVANGEVLEHDAVMVEARKRFSFHK